MFKKVNCEVCEKKSAYLSKNIRMVIYVLTVIAYIVLKQRDSLTYQKFQ